ncbi:MULTISPECIES: hypothetical protein [unclassified Shewanella]|uniref:hypothetical protein n=1 Tax=unclassified Shewanella TaxID=196818 RepID=UPI001BC62DFD|nr:MULTISPECIES: hypothetical protein [unclassified Shewanella]GIU20674.1 hypothetical protein TUM4444_39190 [Shewanella sp. MBTL60-112-B1]GIU40042.1 hypothetical protein TUM4445_38330 [Shewanella sp. MBTL60-112-B2]
MNKYLVAAITLALSSNVFADAGHHGHILSQSSDKVASEFDLTHAKVVKNGTSLTFQAEVTGKLGQKRPQSIGKLAGAEVYSYVWPTNLDSEAVGFEKGQGILALAVTSHPDFDDTPKFDENLDGDKANDGNEWHSHWVVLAKDEACGGGLKVKDIPEGMEPALPVTWPGLPIYIDSPGYTPEFVKNSVSVEVPTKDISFQEDFKFDAVTAVLKVNASVHNPLLCVTQVNDIASGDLSLPGKVVARK